MHIFAFKVTKRNMKYTKILLLLALIMATPCSAKNKDRAIKNVSPLNITTPVNTAPRLPWKVMVTYNDDTTEWRQVRWNGSNTKHEAWMSSAPTGSEYTVKGWIIGDNTTAEGFPVTATINVTEIAWATPARKPQVTPLPLKDVRLTGSNRLTANRDRNIAHLLSLDVTKMLWNYRDTYGLPTDGYAKSEGWDAPEIKLKGHGTGHYLSGLALAYTATDNDGQRQQLHQRIERMVREMRECQERTFVWSDSLGRYLEARDYAPEAELLQMKSSWADFDRYKQDYPNYGYGYLNAIPAAHPALVECYRPYNNDTGLWAPYYTIHKQLAGLIEVAYAMKRDDPKLSDLAFLTAKDMGLWVWNRLHYRTYLKNEGTREQLRERPGNRREMWDMYISGEVGGMAESLVRLSQMATDPVESEHLMEAAAYFDAPAFFDPVANGVDNIRNRHANQHIPMIIGALLQFQNGAAPSRYNLAYNFWHLLQGRYTYAMGGVGHEEKWGEPYTQMEHMIANPVINETCCAYNLAKLTRDLNTYEPDNAEYMDYYERILYNQIVGSLHPTDWAVTYHYAVGTKARKPFGNNTPQESCCGGTGVENHVKYQESAYFTSDNTLYVALYMPTEATWQEKGITIRQECQWPADHSTITFNGSESFALQLRVPYWATRGFDIRLNGKSISRHYTTGTYVEIPQRTWKPTDRVEVIMPFQPHICWGPDKVEGEWLGTLMYGPLAMATTDIEDWSNTILSIAGDMSNIHPCKTQSPYGETHALKTTAGGKEILFTPDYVQTDSATHYFKIRVLPTQE